jgi:hypothetical protein
MLRLDPLTVIPSELAGVRVPVKDGTIPAGVTVAAVNKANNSS